MSCQVGVVGNYKSKKITTFESFYKVFDAYYEEGEHEKFKGVQKQCVPCLTPFIYKGDEKESKDVLRWNGLCIIDIDPDKDVKVDESRIRSVAISDSVLRS